MFIIRILLCTIFASSFHKGYGIELKKSSSPYKSDFLRLLSNRSKFIDKTLFIDEFFKEPGNYRSLSCPTNFGKSSLLNMLKFFVQIEVNENGTIKSKLETRSYKLFTKTSLGFQITPFEKIIKKHLAEYPVIHISFKGIVKATLQDSLQALYYNVRTAFATYDWLHDLLTKESNAKRCPFQVLDRIKNNSLSGANLTGSLYELSELLFCYFDKQVFVFIDDHDAALSEAFANEFDFDIKQIHDLIIAMTSELLHPKSKHFVAYAFITSVIQTVPNREDYPRTINHYRFLKSETLATFCGFSDDEVISLLNRHNKPTDMGQRSILKRFYNGYGVTVLFPGIYNPCTIKKYLYMSEGDDILSLRQIKKIRFLPVFFKNTLLYKTVLHLAFSKSNSVYSNVQWFNVDKVVSLIENIRRQEPPQDYNVDVFFWYMLENGYFTYCEKPPAHFRVPNEGIRTELVNYLFEFYDQELANETVEIANIVNEILQGEIQACLFEKLKRFLDSFVSKMTRYFHQSTNKEYHYQAVLYYWIKRSFINTSFEVSISLHDKDDSSNVITVTNSTVFLMIQLKCKCKFQEVLKEVQQHNSSLKARYPKFGHYLAINYKRNFTQIAYCNLTESSSLFIDDFSIPKTTTSSITWITKFWKKISKNTLPKVKYHLGLIE